MVLNGQAIRDAASGFRALFTQGWEQSQPIYLPYCMRTESQGYQETYEWLTELPMVREWLGDRQVQNLEGKSLTVVNKTWEETLAIKREVFEDDRLGLFQPTVRMMGVQARNHPDELLADLLNDGFSSEAYDGENFFSEDHDWGSNKVTGALSTTTFNTAIQQMRQMTTHRGDRKINIFTMGGSLHLMVAANLESTGRQLLEAALGSGGATNTDFGRAELVVNSSLEDGYWFLIMVLPGGLAPFIFQMRREPTLVARDAPEGEAMFNKNRVEFGVDGRWNMAYGMPQLIQGSNGS